jgi:molybdopterin/thiamine biosynthesis adenylyltransferase
MQLGFSSVAAIYAAHAEGAWLTSAVYVRMHQRAEASLARAAELNPFVSVDAQSADAAEKPEDFFEKFDLVLVSTRSIADQVVWRPHHALCYRC